MKKCSKAADEQWQNQQKVLVTLFFQARFEESKTRENDKMAHKKQNILGTF
jgi:hypothetical protein